MRSEALVFSFRVFRHLIAALLCLFPSFMPVSRSSVSAAENSIPTQLQGRDALIVGTDWYPEQWPEARWETDLQMMEAAHLQVVRIAEFSWSHMEPSDGRFDFDWLDHAIRLAEKHHIMVVLGTPTAAPPAWLTQKYPETLRMPA